MDASLLVLDKIRYTTHWYQRMVLKGYEIGGNRCYGHLQYHNEDHALIADLPVWKFVLLERLDICNI